MTARRVGSMSDVTEYLRARTNYELTKPLRRTRWGLDRMGALLAALGNPQRDLPAVHVAGTKGKGSTVLWCEAIVESSGVRTGAYLSPHVRHFLERFRIGGREARPDEFVPAFAEVAAAAESLPARLGRSTFFELATAAAWTLFRRAGVRVPIIEVGMGGRLDATNVLRPAVTAITAIGLDHQHVLGETLAEIACEKAGILKPDVPAIVAPQRAEAWRAVRKIAARVGAPLRRVRPLARPAASRDGDSRVDLRLPGDELRGVPLGSGGGFQAVNLSTALEAALALERSGWLALRPERLRAALEAARFPGRLTRVDGRPPIVLDGAHNPLGAAALAAALRAERPARRWTIVIGIAADKDLPGFLAPFRGLAARVAATRYESPRALPARTVARAAARSLGVDAEAFDDPREALRDALQRTEPGEGVLVTGSFYLVGALWDAAHDAVAHSPAIRVSCQTGRG